MNRPGYCTDNAEVESFFHTLKGDILRKIALKVRSSLEISLSVISSIFITVIDCTQVSDIEPRMNMK